MLLQGEPLTPVCGAVSTDQAVSQSLKLTLTPISRMWANACQGKPLWSIRQWTR